MKTVSEGRAKVGRWDYPARELENGGVERNTKRDGSGSWVPVSKLVYDRQTAAPAAKKPNVRARSSWEVGTPCPQGHVLREEDIYTMPSGRRQCRVCRGGYDSNI